MGSHSPTRVPGTVGFFSCEGLYTFAHVYTTSTHGYPDAENQETGPEYKLIS